MNFGRVNFTGDYGLFSQGAVSAPLFALLPSLSTLSSIAGVAGTAVSAVGTIAAGSAAKASAEFEADQLRKKGAESLAASQREAEDRRKQTELVMSRQQAGAASSGLGALDPTVLALAGDTFQQGTLNSEMATYTGLSQRAGYMDQANAAIASGKAAQKGSYLGAAGTLLGGVSSFGSKYASINKPVNQQSAAPANLYNEDDMQNGGRYG